MINRTMMTTTPALIQWNIWVVCRSIRRSSSFGSVGVASGAGLEANLRPNTPARSSLGS